VRTVTNPAVLARHDLVHPDGRAFHIYGNRVGSLAGQPALTDDSALESRFDLATGTWIAISPARNTRPAGEQRTTECPLCPGGVEIPFPYDAAVFDNRFPAFSPQAPLVNGPGLAPSRGRCEVVVYTSNHEGSMATLTPEEVARVVAVWRDRTTDLWADGHAYVMAFENRGAEIGATLSHPHGQIYAVPFVPPFVADKVQAAAEHRATTGCCVGCDLVAEAEGERTVVANASFAVAVPFAPRWPYEIHVRARRHGCARLSDLSDVEALDLAVAIREVVNRFDGLFGFELPYMMVVQEAPDGCADWHLHAEFLPVHRSADRIKVRASVETALGVFINDTWPEQNALLLAGVDVTAAPSPGVVVPAVQAAEP
jgi:UDPglucose--hexose-1-phosphate uridylyltransferase